jgi:hypothetical protein
MALGLSRGRRMKPISQHILQGHLQRLREIFGRRFEAGYGGDFLLQPSNVAGPGLLLELQANASTIKVNSDREIREVAAVLSSADQRRVLCSFVEVWRIVRPKNPEYRFQKTGMTFFFGLKTGDEFNDKQIFRFEWDNWEHQEQPNKAAYPHWQFDRWLTASKIDESALATLREAFQTQEEQSTDVEPAVFESAQEAIRQTRDRRPNLGWFTRLHFPAIAPWATDPIKDLEDTRYQPHRCIPQSVTELEDWIESSLRYLKNEFETYGVKQ